MITIKANGLLRSVSPSPPPSFTVVNRLNGWSALTRRALEQVFAEPTVLDEPASELQSARIDPGIQMGGLQSEPLPKSRQPLHFPRGEAVV